MSKERELLKKIWEDLDGDRDNYSSLCDEIEELLAQPEQESPTRKPLSDEWFGDNIGLRGLRYE